MATEHQRRHDTRQRLLRAGGEVFARDGFRGATVRRIAQRAKANLAAIAYHFGGKEGLYLAVLEQSFAVARAKYPPDMGVAAEAGPEERLRAFITAMLLWMLDKGKLSWHGKLMIRELADPSPVLDRVVEEAIRPLHDRLAGIVGELLAAEADSDAVRLTVMSILGQCLFYRNSQPVVSRLYPGRFDAARIRELAEHITAFSLRALRGEREGGRGAE